MSEATYAVSREELERLSKFADVPMIFHETPDSYHDEAEIGNAQDLLTELARAALSSVGDGFAQFVQENAARIHEAARYSDGIAEALVLGYRLGISAGSAACMNDLGALYYMGELVEQDYAKAAELYEMAMRHGCFQSVINLGYIYEYGRTGERDFGKAFRFYALAAALAPSCEATYKLGDMFSRGQATEANLTFAKALWERSLELAESPALAAQPAIRIARLLIDPNSAELGIELDPLRALSLFQRAEVGLRMDIADGLYYYRRRLAEAIKGQAQARAMLDDDSIEVTTQ